MEFGKPDRMRKEYLATCMPQRLRRDRSEGRPFSDLNRKPQPFRRSVCSMLNKRPDLQIVGEVWDGLEAVNKAEELQPDLILLDVGLPCMDGIEAALRIRMLCPDSKILFVSQESSADVVREAFRLGALGYTVKTRVAGDLLPAVEAVLQGGRFVARNDHVRNQEQTLPRSSKIWL